MALIGRLEDTTSGRCIEFPAPWIGWIEEYATNGRIILFAVVFGLIAYLMIMAQNTEFEYSYFDGELRFAKIKNKSRRKRLGIYSMESVAAIAPAGDRSVYNYENGNEIKKIDYTSGQKDVPYYDIVIKSPDENVLIKAELDDRFLTEVEKKYRSKVKRREE